MGYNEIRCNYCGEVRNCTLKVDSKICSQFKRLPDFKMPLLHHALYNNPDSVNKVLENADIRLKEKNSYPYFKLIVE